MRTRFMRNALYGSLLLSVFSLYGCSNEMEVQDDGQKPVLNLTTDHIRSDYGREFKIEGKISDQSGIRSIRLECPDLFLDKTIDLLQYYSEPQYEYNLSYAFTLPEELEKTDYTIKVTVTDLSGEVTEGYLLLTLDLDEESPVFTAFPEGNVTVFSKGDRTALNLHFAAQDNKSLSYIAVDMLCSSNPDFVVNDTLWASEANTSLLDYMKSIPLSADYLNYDCKITAMDKQNNKTEKNFTVSVTALSDYTKMYLADVDNAEALTSDLLGVPMLIDHVGEFQYEARYYSKAPNTEIRFIPQKTDFSPVCFGLDPDDPTKITDAFGLAEPIILPEKGYYKVSFNIQTGDLNVEKYTPDTEVLDYTKTMHPDSNPVNDYLFHMVISGNGLPTNSPDTWSPNWACSLPLEQDQDNKYILYTEMTLQKGADVRFGIYPFHPWGWWLEPAWHFENISGENEYLITNNSMEMTSVRPKFTGTYRFEMDYHLCRAKLYPVE